MCFKIFFLKIDQSKSKKNGYPSALVDYPASADISSVKFCNVILLLALAMTSKLNQ